MRVLLQLIVLRVSLDQISIVAKNIIFNITLSLLLGLLGGAELRRIHSYAFLLDGDPGDSWPADAFKEAGNRAAGCPVNSGGLKPRLGPTAPDTADAAEGPPAAAAAAAAAA